MKKTTRHVTFNTLACMGQCSNINCCCWKLILLNIKFHDDFLSVYVCGGQ